MSKNHILAIVVLVALASSIGIWALSLSPTSSPPQSNTNNVSQHTDSHWTFPLDREPATPLPDLRPVVAEVMPSVVSVTTEMVFSSLFGQSTKYVAGSGILIDDKGYIVTNNHVVEDAQSLRVELADGRTFPATTVGTDTLSDLAVIKIDATDLSYASWGDSSSLAVGEWVLAIGNALGEGITATEGIVSRLNVSLDVGEGNTLYGLIQTTAAVNPGNSGGPLVNMAGQVIGINSVKIVASAVEGIGYAISSDEAKPIIQHLIRHGHVSYPWLGVGLYSVDPSLAAAMNLSVDRGALIVELIADSPADAAGLRKDDIIIRFGDKEISDVADLVQAIRSSEIGEEVEIIFVRGKDTKITSARLAERPTS